MSYTYDSSILNKSVKEQPVAIKSDTTAKSSSDVNIFSAANTQKSKEKEVQKEVKRDFDIDELIKKYKKDPMKIFDEIGLNFSDEQKAELREYLSDKKDLKSFLSLVKQEALTSEDILAGVGKLKKQKPSGIFKRIGNFFKKLFKEGFAEAFKLAKSERIYKAEKLGENMQDIREEREDYTSKSVADIAETFVEKPDIKENGMHFVSKKDTDGTHLYSEDATIQAVGYMAENEDKADTFTANAAELESIKNDNNKIKYNGSTIINVTERMTEKMELKRTMMAVAKKRDMTNEYFDNITKNVFENPNMEQSVYFTVTAKGSDGKDRFSANNANNASNYLLNKNESFCNTYHSNIVELSQNENLSNDQIMEINKTITEYPEIKDQILEKVRTSNLSGNELVKACDEYEKEAQEARTASSVYSANKNSRGVSGVTNSISDSKNNTNHQATATVSSKNNAEQKDTTTIKGVDYPRKTVLEALYKLYGPSSEKILQKLEDDPKFIDLIKKYGNQRVIVEALVKDPTIITKLKNSSASISTSELVEMLNLCNNQKSVNTLAELTTKYGATKSIKMLRDAQMNNSLAETSDILSKSTIDSREKKKQIEQLNNNGGRTFIS